MAKTAPMVAIITRTMNRGGSLTRAVKSVDLQTFTDYEHIVVNDGGDKKEVDKILSRHLSPKRRVVHCDENIGRTAALNLGIQRSRAQYIAILDDDDSWSEDRLQVAINYMEEFGSAGSVSVMDKVEEEVSVEDGSIKELSSSRWRPDITAINLYEQCLDNHLSNGCFMYRRDIYDELGGYDESLDVAEDWDFGLRFLQKYDVDFIDTGHALVNYHLRPKSEGDLGNSVVDDVKTHERDVNKILNKYLRQDLANGALGIGYIMNSLKFDQKRRKEGVAVDIENVVRLEGHINRVEKSIKTEIHEVHSKTLYETAKRTLNKLR